MDVSEILSKRDEDTGNTLVELAQVDPKDKVSFKVCRVDDLVSFTIEINNRTIPIPTPGDGSVYNCYDSCIIDIASFNAYNNSVIKVKPGSILTFFNSITNATDIGINQVLSGTCDVLENSIFNNPSITHENPYRIIIPRSLVGQTIDFAVFPFCGSSDNWSGKIVVGKVTNQVFTLHFPKYYFGDSCVQSKK